MAVKRKTTILRRKAKADSANRESIFKRLNCASIRFEFKLPARSFNAKRFYSLTGIEPGNRWSAVLGRKQPMTGYHVHFSGSIDAKYARMTVEYRDKGINARPKEPEPFSESIMQWLGPLVAEPSVRVSTSATFTRSTTAWRSRFNLPFKVTMAGEEVTIEGIALKLPRNSYRATSAFMATNDETLYVSLFAMRSIAFDKFNIDAEVSSLDEATKIFSEPLR
jgi:hypothetical protein